MVKSSFLRFSLVLGVLFLSACGARQERPAELGPDVLFERGMTAYEAGRHGRAIELLEPFVLMHVGDPRVPDARMALAHSHMARREFITAANEFQRLVTDFPNHPQALEARFGICDAYYRLSPSPARDQEYTHAAVAHCGSVAAFYPGTPEAAEAEERVTELRERLAQKEFDTGMFYFRRRAFDAAVIYFEAAANQYPDTRVAAPALLRLYETYSQIGYVEEAQEVRERLLRDYPQSPEAQGLRA